MITIKGKHAILEALETTQAVKHVMIAEGAQSNADIRRIISVAKQNRVRISTLSKFELAKKFPEGNTQSIIAEMTSVPHLGLNELLKQHSATSKYVILDHLEDPYNFGAIMRTAVALGVDAIIYPKDRQVSITAGVIKASSGAAYKIPLVRVPNVAQCVETLKKHDIWVYGTNVENGEPLNRVRVNTPFALVVGNESKGVSKRISKLVDCNVHIPTTGRIESLNVSVATGILLYSMCNPS
jgi:23S rRNA (guanosine2251-2'-O)-methyltransferase